MDLMGKIFTLIVKDTLNFFHEIQIKVLYYNKNDFIFFKEGTLTLYRLMKSIKFCLQNIHY